MVQIKSKKEKEKKLVTEGEMEHEVYLEREDIADFLISLGEQMKEKDEVTIETENWKIPFKYRSPVKLEIDFEGHGDRELEIEVEMKGKNEEKAPNVS
ncbi:MAG: amphi-Trp domain-containing protein [archaeon]